MAWKHVARTVQFKKSSWMQCQLPYSGSEALLSGVFDFASVASCFLSTLLVATWGPGVSFRFAPELSTVGVFDIVDSVPVTFDCRKPWIVVISAFMLAGTNGGKSNLRCVWKQPLLNSEFGCFLFNRFFMRQCAFRRILIMLCRHELFCAVLLSGCSAQNWFSASVASAAV